MSAKKGTTKRGASSQSNPVGTVYSLVIQDVIENIKEDFADEGVGEQVLAELQRLWEYKLVESGAVPSFQPQSQPQEDPTSAAAIVPAIAPLHMQQYSHINPELQDIRYMQQTPPMQYIDMKPDPIIGRPQQFLYTDYQQQDQNQYQQYYQQPVQYMEPPAKKMRPNPNITRQEDGEDDDDWGDGDSSEEDTKQKAPASRDDNLNSDDDLSDEEGDIPQTNHIVLSQFEKVTRTKNKWKCALKCGIMHLNGQDYVFNRASGEFDW